MSACRRAFEQCGNVAICQHVAELLNNVVMMQYVSMSPSFCRASVCTCYIRITGNRTKQALARNSLVLQQRTYSKYNYTFREIFRSV